jgi:K+-transporting ATPase ATPase C chain
MRHQIAPAFRLMLVLTVFLGLVYPGVITAISQVLFRWQANGSMLKVDGKEIGSALIGQNFTKPEYFHPRPSAAGNDGYDATASTGSNYGPTNQKLIDRVKSSVEQFRKENPDYTGPIPADLLTASASGLDPDISPASAEAQAARVAKARGVSLEQIDQFITQNTKGPDLGFLGEPRVNVLELNLELDQQFPLKKVEDKS